MVWTTASARAPSCRLRRRGPDPSHCPVWSSRPPSRKSTSGYLLRNVNDAVADAQGRENIGLPDLAQIEAMQEVLDSFLDGIDPSDLTIAYNAQVVEVLISEQAFRQDRAEAVLAEIRGGKQS